MGMLNYSPILDVSIKKSLLELPLPSRISYWWNFGSLLGVCLVIQIISGLFLSIHFCGDVSLAFDRVRHIIRDVNYGWVFRIRHANGARLFFICLYLHIGRGLYYGSYSLKHTWIVGVSILLATIATAFLGYVLPWGQMSFWGATVITNLFSAIPYIGTDIVNWIWGGFAVDNATLNRFYSLHFLLPFVIAALVITHLIFLHITGSSNPLGTMYNRDKISFSPYFTRKDYLGLLVIIRLFTVICSFEPWSLGDPENFLCANPLVTPVHIQPEWYFLFAYAILRSIPNKLGGVIALGLSVLVLYVVPLITVQYTRSQFKPFGKLQFWGFVNIVLLLTWIGARPVEDPYIVVGQILTILYFMYYFIQIFNK